MSTFRKFIILQCLLIMASSAFGADAVVPWAAPHFSMAPDALHKAASESVPADGTDVTVLDEEESHVYDASGRSVYSEYLVYKVLTQKGADEWDNISVDWEPWHDEQPKIRARVITSDYAVHDLDLKTVADAPAQDEDSNVYSDRRVMRGPLPAIAPGSVVEQEIVVRESAPFFVAGIAGRYFSGRSVPVRHERLTLEAPTSLPLHYELQLLPDLEPKRTEANGQIKLIFERGPVEPQETSDSNLPNDVPAFPAVSFSTGTSWQQVAAEYEKIVEAHLDGVDLKPVVEKLTQGKRSRNEKAQAVLEYLDKQIRYTGVEFGDAAIVPHSPAETLARRYGDCKDKSTLLVAMLRAAGIPAYVALLNVGDRLDVPSDLPGMGLFDHAVVYVPGDADLWIDATDEYASLGQLPILDQSRLALIVRAQSTALVRIPEAPSQDNVILERRDIYLAENGPARIVETSQPKGVFESEYRSLYADKQNKKTHEDLTTYVKSQYLSEKLDRIDRSDPDDLSKQFELVLESEKARRGFTDLDSAVAAIRYDGLFDHLPDELQKRADDESKDQAAGKKRVRTADYQLPEPFATEWHYNVVPPLGFQPKPLPQDVKLSLGPAVLTEHFEVNRDGNVRAVIRFDTVKRRLTVSEATEMRNKIAELRDDEPIFINFEPQARALLEQGKLRESFQSYRSLISQHPTEALHHLQIAKAFLDAGMGDAARQEARAAVKLDPKSALAEKTLAEVLEYDLVGRKFRSGSDYLGAVGAFREALTLDPDDKTTAGNLAILLEYDDYGARYGAGAKLREAIAEYRTIGNEKLASIGLSSNLAYALFYAGEFAEARKSADNLNPQPKALMIACEAALNGSPAGLKEASKLFSNDADLRNNLKTAGNMLMNIRKYSLAADFLEAGASGDNTAATMGLASRLRKAYPHEQLHFGNTPRDLVMSFFLLSLDPNATLEKVSALTSKNGLLVMKNTEREDLEKALRTGKDVRRKLAHQGSPPDLTVDILMQIIEPKEDGDDASGYRERMQIPGAQNITMFVVKEDGKYKLLDTSKKSNAIGLEILDRVASKDLGGAATLLNWLRDEQHLEGGDDPLTGEAFPRFWTKGRQADAAQMKLAAAAILVQTKPTAKQGIEILEDAKKSATTDSEKADINLGLLIGYSNLENYEKMLYVSSELASQYPESKRAFLSECLALRALGRIVEADRLSQERLNRTPDDLDGMRELVFNAAARGDYGTAYDLAKKVANSGKAESADWNQMAWLTLFFARTDGPDVDAATKAAQLSQNDPHILHTLGCLYAEIGKTKEAREVLIHAMDLQDLEEPNPDYWYAFGRIAEQYGEREIAAADYVKVSKPKQAFLIPMSAYRLAQDRIDKIPTPQSSVASSVH